MIVSKMYSFGIPYCCTCNCKPIRVQEFQVSVLKNYYAILLNLDSNLDLRVSVRWKILNIPFKFIFKFKALYFKQRFMSNFPDYFNIYLCFTIHVLVKIILYNILLSFLEYKSYLSFVIQYSDFFSLTKYSQCSL